MNRSQRWVERNTSLFSTSPLGDAGNGCPAVGVEVKSLPSGAQRKYADNVLESATQGPGQLALELTMPIGMNLSPEGQLEAERRFRIIEPLATPATYRGLWAQSGQSKTEVVKFLALQHKTTGRTIYRWFQRWSDGGLPALAPKDRSDKAQPRKPNPAALDFLLAAASPRQGAYGELSVREIHRAYQEESAWRAAHAGQPLGEFESHKYSRYTDEKGKLSTAAQLPELSYDTMRRYFYRIPEVVRALARSGQEAFSNTQEIISFRDLGALLPLDYVVMDHRCLDLFCMIQVRDGWKLIRPWLTASIDMRTRKWLAWTLVETPSSDSIAYVLKRSFILHGLPKAVYWDNGKDFRCHYLEGKQTKIRESGAATELSDGWRGVLETLGIRVHHAIVRRARAKIIEPNFRATALFDKSLPWWCGHRPTTRPERFQDLLDRHAKWIAGEAESPAFPTIQQLAADYDDQMEALNERERPHSQGMQKVTATGRGWMGPNECWEKLIGQVDRRDAPPEVLQFAFNKRRDLTVKHGEVRTAFHGQQFHYRLNDSSVKLMALNGLKIQFAYDPMDLETAALYYRDRFVGLATCVELRRMGESEDAFVQDERDRRASRREVTRFIARVHQQVHIPDHRERANRRREVLPVRVEPKRPEIAAEVPKAVADAAASASGERKFSFAAAPAAGAELIARANDNAYRDDDDATFQFFKDEVH
jgi:hypothetical protein